MINKTEIQFQAIVAELRAQRDALGDRAANLAAELSVSKTENKLLEARVKNLEEQVAKSGNADAAGETLGERSEAVGGAG
jgi:hypothetical protein